MKKSLKEFEYDEKLSDEDIDGEFSESMKINEEKSMQTPWGTSEIQKKLTDKHNPNIWILRVDTSTHGGYFVPAQVVQTWKEPFKSYKPFAGKGWYEEDCDWSVVALAMPQFFSKKEQELAKITFEKYCKKNNKNESFENKDMKLIKTKFGYNFWKSTNKEGKPYYNVTPQSQSKPPTSGYMDANFICKIKGVPNCFEDTVTNESFEIVSKTNPTFRLCDDGKFRHCGFHDSKKFVSKDDAIETLNKLKNKDRCKIISEQTLTEAFTEDSDNWFDDIANIAKNKAIDIANLLSIAKKLPTKENFIRFKKELNSISGLDSLKLFIKNIDSEKYNKEYKFIYNKPVSLIGEFFGLFRQACEYEKSKILTEAKYTKKDIGAYFDGFRGRHIPKLVWDFAKTHGFKPTEEFSEEFDNECEDEATEYMNSKYMVKDAVWGRNENGDWGLWNYNEDLQEAKIVIKNQIRNRKNINESVPHKSLLRKKTNMLETKNMLRKKIKDILIEMDINKIISANASANFMRQKHAIETEKSKHKLNKMWHDASKPFNKAIKQFKDELDTLLEKFLYINPHKFESNLSTGYISYYSSIPDPRSAHKLSPEILTIHIEAPIFSGYGQGETEKPGETDINYLQYDFNDGKKVRIKLPNKTTPKDIVNRIKKDQGLFDKRGYGWVFKNENRFDLDKIK